MNEFRGLNSSASESFASVGASEVNTLEGCDIVIDRLTVVKFGMDSGVGVARWLCGK